MGNHGGFFSLSRNLYVGVGLLDDPLGNVANLPEVHKNAGFCRRDVEDAVPYNYECGFLRQSETAVGNHGGFLFICLVKKAVRI